MNNNKESLLLVQHCNAMFQMDEQFATGKTRKNTTQDDTVLFSTLKRLDDQLSYMAKTVKLTKKLTRGAWQSQT